MGLVSGSNSVWCTPRVVLPGTSAKTSPNSSSKAVKSSVWVEVSWSSAWDNKASTTGTEVGSEVGAGHSISSVTGDWIRTSAGMEATAVSSPGSADLSTESDSASAEQSSGSETSGVCRPLCAYAFNYFNMRCALKITAVQTLYDLAHCRPMTDISLQVQCRPITANV